MMKLGFETIVWGRRIDDLDHMLEVVKACGYEGVELGQNHLDIYVLENKEPKPIRTMARLQQRLRAHGLQLIGLVGGTLRERMAFCADDRSAYLYLDSWRDDYAKALEGNTPFTLALHPHWFMRMRKIRHAETVLEKHRSPHLQLIVDTAHTLIAEDDALVAIEKHLRRLASVHIKDWRPDFGRWSHRYARGFCLPGEGIVPIELVIEKLHQLDYQGWVTLEQDHFEENREQTALACANWAAKQSGRLFRNFTPDASRVSVLARQQHPKPFAPSFPQIQQEVKMAQQLSLAPARGADFFYPLIARLLREAYEAEAVKLWSYNTFTEELCLLSADCEPHLPPCRQPLVRRCESPDKELIESPRVRIHDLRDPDVKELFGDRQFIDAIRSDWMVAVPVFNSANPHQLRYIVNVFLRGYGLNGDSPFEIVENEISVNDRRAAEHYADLLSVWADYLTDEMCSVAAGATSHLCGEFKQGVIPFVDAFLEHLEKLFRCENATLFLVDESRTRLEPAGTTNRRIRWDSNLPQGAQYYQKDDGSLTGAAWSKREMYFSSNAGTAKHKAKSYEISKSERRELLIAPLVRRGGDVLGIVRLHNKQPSSSGNASTVFTDDDAARLDAVIQTALPHLDLLITQRGQNFALTRLAHELQNPLIGILGAAEFLGEGLRVRKIRDLKAELGADYLDDIRSYQALMSRLVSNANLFAASAEGLKPQAAHLDLATAVVIPVRNQLRALLQKHHLPEDGIVIAPFKGTIPWLHVDRAMFQQVFFNLFANAIKYHDKNETFHVEVKVRIEGPPKAPLSYIIEVEDRGIGLDEGIFDLDTMFLPGVRGKNVAQYHNVSGTGVGLSVVKAIIKAHGGSVSFTSPRKPTTVRLCLPAELRHSFTRPTGEHKRDRL